ncbi:hypothetical protein D3C86_1293160 [compost metagenome]
MLSAGIAGAGGIASGYKLLPHARSLYYPLGIIHFLGHKQYLCYRKIENKAIFGKCSNQNRIFKIEIMAIKNQECEVLYYNRTILC